MSTDAASVPAPTASSRAPVSAWIVLFLVAFALRALCAWQYAAGHPNAESLGIDEAAYDAWARRIAAGEVRGEGVFFQEPLYSYVLGASYALFGPEKQLVRLVQSLLGALTCVIVGKVAERVFGRSLGRTSGLVAGALLAVHGPLILFPSFLLKENLLLPLLAAFTWLLVSASDKPSALRPWLACGVLAGLGALLRGNVLVLAPVLAAWPLVRAWRARTPIARALAQSACFAGGVALVLAPVLARNVAVGGAWVLTTSQTGTNVYAGNNAANEHGRPIELGFVRGIPEHEAGDWRREAERRTGRELSASEVSAYWLGETWRSVCADPALHARIVWNKLRLTLGAYEAPDNHLYAWDVQYLPLLALPWPAFGILGALGLAGLAFVALRRPHAGTPGAGDLATLFALYLATIVLTVSSDRARLPLVLWLAPFAGAFVASACAAMCARAWGSFVVRVVVALALVFVLRLPSLPASELGEDFDEREFNLAVQLARDPAQLARAREITSGLVARHPRSARTQLLAIELELRGVRERMAEPVASARAAARADLDLLAERVRALEALPGLPPRELFRARALLGRVELERGDGTAAERAFRGALAFDPENTEVRGGLAKSLVLRAERSTGADVITAARDAEDALAELVRHATSNAERAELALDSARATLARGRALLATGARAEGEAAVSGSLRVLQPFATDETLPRALRAAIRRLAGRIQILVASDAALESAERHFRAALALDDELEGALGLAQVLVARAERARAANTNADDAARMTELRQLVERLAAAEPDHAAVSELRARAGALK